MNDYFSLTIKGKKVYHNNEDITKFVMEMGTFYETVIKNKPSSYACFVQDVIFLRTGCVDEPTKLSDWLTVYVKITQN